jgi:beta-lactamase class A
LVFFAQDQSIVLKKLQANSMKITRVFGLAALAFCLPLGLQAAARSHKKGGQVSTTTLEITTSSTQFSRGFRGKLERIVAAHHGIMGLSLKNLRTGEELSINGNEKFPTASTIKLAVMCTAFDELTSPAGMFKSYYDTRVYDASTSTGGSGFVQHYQDGTRIELKELLHFMITVSDNVATNMLVEWMGLDRINNWLARHGFKDTHMNASIGGHFTWNRDLRREWGIGVTTPNEMCRLLEMIATKTAVDSTSASEEMLRLMSHQYFDDLIAGETPPFVWVGSKSGALNDSKSDNAIIASPGGTYVLSIYTKDNKDRRWLFANEGQESIRKAAREVWKHFNPGSSWKRPAGAEKL